MKFGRPKDRVTMGVERLLKEMNIPFESLEGTAAHVYSKYKKEIELWFKNRYGDKYLLRVVGEEDETDRVFDGKIPLTILKTEKGDFYPIRIIRKPRK